MTPVVFDLFDNSQVAAPADCTNVSPFSLQWTPPPLIWDLEDVPPICPRLEADRGSSSMLHHTTGVKYRSQISLVHFRAGPWYVPCCPAEYRRLSGLFYPSQSLRGADAPDRKKTDADAETAMQGSQLGMVPPVS